MNEHSLATSGAAIVTRVQPAPAFTISAPDPSAIPPTHSILLSIEQVCAYLGGISERKILELVSSRQMPAPKKLGRLARWHRGELDAWADKL